MSIKSLRQRLETIYNMTTTESADSNDNDTVSSLKMRIDEYNKSIENINDQSDDLDKKSTRGFITVDEWSLAKKKLLKKEADVSDKMKELQERIRKMSSDK